MTLPGGLQYQIDATTGKYRAISNRAGTTLTISAEGPDEAHAVQSLIELVQSGFGEESWNA